LGGGSEEELGKKLSGISKGDSNEYRKKGTGKNIVDSEKTEIRGLFRGKEEGQKSVKTNNNKLQWYEGGPSCGEGERTRTLTVWGPDESINGKVSAGTTGGYKKGGGKETSPSGGKAKGAKKGTAELRVSKGQMVVLSGARSHPEKQLNEGSANRQGGPL